MKVDLKKYVAQLPPSIQKRVNALEWLKAGITKEHRFFEISWREEFYRRAFTAQRFNGIDGDYVEFGSWTGTTFTLAFRESRKVGYLCKLWSFDSFQGLPQYASEEDDHPMWVPGTLVQPIDEFHAVCKRNGMTDSDYQVVAGFYEDTLDKRLSGIELPTNISVAWVDCDMYSSTMSVLHYLLPHLKHGMILAFDDYYCWSKDQASGERVAIAEVFSDNPDWNLVPFVQIGWHGMSFMIESKKLLNAASAHY